VLELRHERAEFESRVSIVDDQKYTNRFADVHSKVKVLKDRAREANKKDAELRESRAAEESKKLRDFGGK
jgi:hypothetical protein